MRSKSGNLKLKNVDVSFYDDCTGKRVATSHDNTDVNGNFTVIVPAGTYTFTAEPAACAGYGAYRASNVVIAGATALGSIALDPAVLISGTVHGPNGLPLFDARVKFYDVTVLGAPRQDAARDRTDANGFFSIQVPASTFDLNIEPPLGVNALVLHVNAVPAGANIGTVQMSTGLVLSGHVSGPGATPQANVNINVLDHVTRVQQRVSADNTDAAGNFTLYVNPGTYDIHYDPPLCGGMAPTQQESVIVVANKVLPSMNVVTGVHLTGLVTDPAALPASAVDLDVFPAGSAVKLYTPGVKTTATGTYDALVPPGTYDIHYIPSSLTRWRPAQYVAVPVASSQALPTLALVNGWLVSGTGAVTGRKGSSPTAP